MYLVNKASIWCLTPEHKAFYSFVFIDKIKKSKYCWASTTELNTLQRKCLY